MSEVSPIEVTDLDDVTIVGYRWLEDHGHGKQPTVWRKVRDKRLPEPIEPGKWTLGQIKRHVAAKLAQVAA